MCNWCKWLVDAHYIIQNIHVQVAVTSNDLLQQKSFDHIVNGHYFKILSLKFIISHIYYTCSKLTSL